MNQADAILEHLKRGDAITPIDALNLYGCFRLAARIDDLRKSGHFIETEIIKKDGKKYARYYIPRFQQMDLIA